MLDPAKTRILVTGGTGFIGRYVVEMLRGDGFTPLVTTFKATAGMGDLVNIDLTKAAQIDDLVRNYRPQIVLHLAGVTGDADPTGKIYDEINFHGTVNLLKALDGVGIDRVVLLGTAAEYGDQPTPFCEDMPARPVSHYASSKARASQLALDMHSASGFPVTILRVFTAYGYGQPGKMFLSQLIRHGILNQCFKMSDGLQRRDLVHIDDVAEAVKAAMTAEKAVGRAINIAGGKGMALRDIAKEVWQLCNADSDLLQIGSREKSGDDCFDTEADISRAAEILNWRPGPGILSKNDDHSRLREMIEKMKNPEVLTAGK